MSLASWLPASLKNDLRGFYRRWDERYIRWRYGFGKEDLLAGLRGLGIQSGDAVFVHSSAGALKAFQGTLMDVIGVLQEAVSPGGTLMLPAFSFSGSAVEHARKNKVFDPATSPSQVGLLSEIFRRGKGVVRSLHPTHSVAAWGSNAEDFVRDHQAAATPCGRGTPLHKLIEADGKVLLIGVGISILTLFHTMEELLEDRMPFSPFTEEMFTLRCRVRGATLEAGPMRLYEPRFSRLRRLEPLAKRLRAQRQWRQVRTGNLEMIAISARAALSAVEAMASKGHFLYEGYLPPDTESELTHG